jgi:hypothetical protein
VEHAETLEEVAAWVAKISMEYEIKNDAAKKFFSFSYGTKWQGAEGKLAAEIVDSLIKSHFCDHELSPHMSE